MFFETQCIMIVFRWLGCWISRVCFARLCNNY